MPAERPVWLTEEPELLGLLGAVLDLFDRQRGVDRTRRIVLAVLEKLPSLSRADATADQTWSFVRELERRGVLGVREGRRGPYDVEWHCAKLAFVPEVEETLRAWLGRAWSEPVMLRWRRAVEKHAAAFHDGGAALLAQRIVIENRSADEVVAALAAAARLTGSVTLRQLSATVFWGDSKVLDERRELVAAVLPHLSILDRPLVIAAHLPATCHGVLFIENQDTYTAAVAGHLVAARELALVYAAGFRGSASRVRQRTGSVLHVAGPGLGGLLSRFEAWWYDGGVAFGPCWFWGDLDFAGMQILKALRSRFEELEAWRPGYGSLMAQLQTRGGYGSRRDDGRGQVDPRVTGCIYADEVLLPVIRERGRRDQEGME